MIRTINTRRSCAGRTRRRPLLGALREAQITTTRRRLSPSECKELIRLTPPGLPQVCGSGSPQRGWQECGLAQPRAQPMHGSVVVAVVTLGSLPARRQRCSGSLPAGPTEGRDTCSHRPARAWPRASRQGKAACVAVAESFSGRQDGGHQRAHGEPGKLSLQSKSQQFRTMYLKSEAQRPPWVEVEVPQKSTNLSLDGHPPRLHSTPPATRGTRHCPPRDPQAGGGRSQL